MTASPAGPPAEHTDGREPAWRPLARRLDLAPLENDLLRVEAALERMLEVPGRPGTAEAIGYVVAAGGKRLRPLLVLLGHYAGQQGPLRPAPEAAVALAAAIEILHVHTLYHDDVMDNAATRRGVPTALARWGERAAVALGNVLCARAFAPAARLGRPYGQLMAAAYQEVCRGQSLEMTAAFDVERSQQDYLASIAGKTAFLLGAAARLGAMTAGEGAADVVDEMWSACFHYGIAFQLIDDLLDFVADAGQLGKPVCNDVKEGVYSLPLLLAMRDDPAIPGLVSGDPTPGRIDELRLRFAATGAIEASVRLAKERCVAARQILIEAPGVHPEVRRALTSFAGVMFAPLVTAGVEVAVP